MSIPASVFKAECLKLMDEVARTGQPVVITNHGKPVAQLVPVPPGPKSRFGYMRNTVTIQGDIVGPASARCAVAGLGRESRQRAGYPPDRFLIATARAHGVARLLNSRHVRRWS